MQEQTRQGIAALKAGDKARARALLAAAVKENARDEYAWLGLSVALEDEDKKRYCLEQVLSINPSNQAALQAMVELQEAKAAQTGPDQTPVDEEISAPYPAQVSEPEPLEQDAEDEWDQAEFEEDAQPASMDSPATEPLGADVEDTWDEGELEEDLQAARVDSFTPGPFESDAEDIWEEEEPGEEAQPAPTGEETPEPDYSFPWDEDQSVQQAAIEDQTDPIETQAPVMPVTPEPIRESVRTAEETPEYRPSQRRSSPPPAPAAVTYSDETADAGPQSRRSVALLLIISLLACLILTTLVVGAVYLLDPELLSFLGF
jgi:hypothetical protein